MRSWLVVNIGDSRTYLLNSDGLRQLSVDHTVVRELVDAGAILRRRHPRIPSRNLLTRALLGRSGTQPTLAAADARRRPLVCSDGLTNVVDDRSTAAVLRAVSDPQSAADELISAAMRAGGRDDATALVIDVVAIPAGSVSDPDGTPSLTALHAGD